MPRIALISDTHSLLRPQAKAFLQGSAAIIHAGDNGGFGILDELRALAPLTAIRGNNDGGARAETLRATELIHFGTLKLYVIHDIAELDIDPIAGDVRVVVSGHSHKPSITECNGVLYVNPGSAGPRRFKLPITAAELLIVGSKASARIFDLEAGRYRELG